MTTIYASVLDLARWITGNPAATEDQAPENATVLLRVASQLVAGETRAALYHVDDEGLPTDDKVLGAMRDATLTMAEAWSLADLDPRRGRGQVRPTVASKGLNGASVSYAADSGAAEAISDLASGSVLTEAAGAILDAQNLRPTTVLAAPNWSRDVYAIGFDPTTGHLQP